MVLILIYLFIFIIDNVYFFENDIIFNVYGFDSVVVRIELRVGLSNI